MRKGGLRRVGVERLARIGERQTTRDCIEAKKKCRRDARKEG